VKSDIDKARAEKFTLEGHIETTQSTLSSISTDVYNLQEQKNQVDSQIILLERTKAGIQNEIATLNNQLEALKTQLADKLALIQSENDRKIADSDKKREEAEKKLSDVRNEVSASKVILKEIKSLTEALQDENTTLSTSIDSQKKEFTALAGSIENLKADKQIVAEKLEAEYVALVQKNKEQKDENDKQAIENAVMKAEFDKVQKEAFALAELKTIYDKRDKDQDAREAKIVELYNKAGVPIK
jgi:chromosome segregation ATPase